MSQCRGAQESSLEEAARYNAVPAVSEHSSQEHASPTFERFSDDLNNPALKRWGSPSRTAPLLNASYLLLHLVVALVPVLRVALPSVGCSAEIAVDVFFIVMLLLTAVVALWACAEALRHSLRKGGPRSGGEDTQHVVCIMIYNEPDEMILSTLKHVNDSPVAPRIRVVIAMEEKTDRQDERARTYASFLTNVHSTRHYVHPAGLEGESRGLCSNVAWAMSSYLKEHLHELASAGSAQEDPLSNFIFTKLDSQLLLHEEYFSELEYHFSVWRKRPSRRPVVFQALMLSHLHRGRTYGPARAVGAMRVTAYGFLFSCGIILATLYSVPLSQYINIGLHHPSYIAEDFMMLTQSAVTSRRVAKVVLMPRTPAATAVPLGDSLCQSLMELWRQNKRWAAQTTEAAEFVARNGGCCRVRTAAWLALYGIVKVAFFDGIGVYLTVAAIAGQPEDCSEVELAVLRFTSLAMPAVIVFACLFMAPVLDQVLSCTLPCKLPLWQLPLTMLCSVPALLYQNITHIVAYYHLLIVGKRALSTHKVRAKVV